MQPKIEFTFMIFSGIRFYIVNIQYVMAYHGGEKSIELDEHSCICLQIYRLHSAEG